MLSDTEKIKDERRKAKENKSKYGAVSSDQLKGGGAVKFQGFGPGSFSGAGTSENGSAFRDEESESR